MESRDAATPSTRAFLTVGQGLLVLLVLGLPVGESWLMIAQKSDVPTEADWQAAAETVRTMRGGSIEPILFAPSWIEPIGRNVVGELLNRELGTLSDVDRYGRVWQISIRGAAHPWLQGSAPQKTWQHGLVRVDQFDQKPATVLFDSLVALPQAHVSLRGPDAAECSLRDDRFLCSAKRRWNWVGPYLAEVRFRPYSAVYAHPVDGHVLAIRYADAPLGKNLVVYTGIDDYQNRRRSDVPVTLRIRAGATTLAEIVQVNNDPWVRTEIDTAALAGTRQEITFEVFAAKAYRRAFCFRAETRQ